MSGRGGNMWSSLLGVTQSWIRSEGTASLPSHSHTRFGTGLVLARMRSVEVATLLMGSAGAGSPEFTLTLNEGRRDGHEPGAQRHFFRVAHPACGDAPPPHWCGSPAARGSA